MSSIRRTAQLSVLISAAFLLPALPACTAQHESNAGAGHASEPSANLNCLANWLEGSFSSRAQAAADPDFFDIRLHMVRIWPQRSDAIWLYVEQAAAQSLEKPYRQRVYKLTVGADGELQSEIFELPGAQPDDALRWAGEWKKPRPLADLTPDVLVPRSGCTMYIHRVDANKFAGATRGSGCASSRQGAAYATSELIELTPNGMTTWDRGFDSAGKQVWGAVKGGYQFQRESE